MTHMRKKRKEKKKWYRIDKTLNRCKTPYDDQKK